MLELFTYYTVLNIIPVPANTSCQGKVKSIFDLRFKRKNNFQYK